MEDATNKGTGSCPSCESSQVDPKDAQNNKLMAILAYLGILFLVPLFAAKESPFARFHTNQGLLLFITSFVIGIIINVVARVSLTFGAILSVLYLIPFVFAIIGIINAAKGEMKELPIIGKYRLLK